MRSGSGTCARGPSGCQNQTPGAPSRAWAVTDKTATRCARAVAPPLAGRGTTRIGPSSTFTCGMDRRTGSRPPSWDFHLDDELRVHLPPVIDHDLCVDLTLHPLRVCPHRVRPQGWSAACACAVGRWLAMVFQFFTRLVDAPQDLRIQGNGAKGIGRDWSGGSRDRRKGPMGVAWWGQYLAWWG